MSVTFDVVRDRTNDPILVCPQCGAGVGLRGTKGQDCTWVPPGDDVACSGFGPSYPITGLNVANSNAAAILFDLLGYGRDEKDYAYGDLDPADVLRRLATAEERAAALVRPMTETQGVYIDDNGVGPGPRVVDFGRSEDQVGRYIEGLRKIATEAVEAGMQITYG